MPICAECGTGYDDTDAKGRCPGCGALQRSLGRASSRGDDLRFFALWFARLGYGVGLIVAVIVGILLLVRQEWLRGLGVLLITAPVAYGHWVAFGLVLDLFEEQGVSS